MRPASIIAGRRGYTRATECIGLLHTAGGRSVTECQGCGAWNDASRALCVLCGTPLAATDEWDAAADLPPLPPLPDGGLAASMPSWLRDPPAASSKPQPRVQSASSAPVLAPLGARADPRTFLDDDDFPGWLRDLAARRQAGPTTPADLDPADTDLAPPERHEALAWANWPGAPASRDALPPTPELVAPTVPKPVLPLADERPPTAIVAGRALAERRERGAWETLLLVVLFLGVVIAAVWALVSNGVFSPTL
jgi:hypothetical protein